MKILFHIAFALALGIAHGADAVSSPFNESGQLTEFKIEGVGIPEPARLEANWWRFFEAKGEELESRIRATIQRLKVLLAGLHGERAAAARQFIERIQNNLQALPTARVQPSPPLPPLLGPGESYTVSQLFDIAGRLRKLQAELQADRDDAVSAEAAIKAAHRHIDTQMAAYLALAPTNPERMLRGLEIMADRSAVALTEEELRVRKAALVVHTTLLQQLADEQAVAAKRLVAEPADLARLNPEIGQAQTELAQAQAQLTHAQARAAQARASSLISNNPEDQTTTLYRQQQALRVAVMEAIARVRLLRLQAERHLVSLLSDIPNLDTRALRGQLSALMASLAAIREQAAIWTRDSERERERAGEAAARALGENGATTLTFMRLLNQHRLDLAQETLVALRRLEEASVQASMITQRLDEQLARKEGPLRDWLARAEQALKQIWATAVGWANLSLFKLEGTPVTALGLLRVALIVFGAWWFSYWLRRALKRLGERHEGMNRAALYTVGRLSHYGIIVIGVMVGLASIGADFTNFALVAGAIGIGVGFGLQSIVNNFVSGLILLFERNLKVGDFVELDSGVAGEVREINVRSTLINTNDNVDIVVPNSEFMNSKVTNWTLLEDYRRIHIPFRVAYGSNKDLIKQAALEAAGRLEHTLKTKNPGVWLVDFEDSGLVFELVVWVTPAAVKRPGAVNAEYKWEIETALRKHGIEIPVAQHDLRLRSGFGFKEFSKELLDKN